MYVANLNKELCAFTLRHTLVKYILISGLAIRMARKHKNPTKYLARRQKKKKNFWCISNFYSLCIRPKFHLINSSKIQSVRVLTYQNHVKKAKCGINVSKQHVIFPYLTSIPSSAPKRVILHKHRQFRAILEQFRRKVGFFFKLKCFILYLSRLLFLNLHEISWSVKKCT